MTKTILRLPQVISRTGIARSTIYQKMNNDQFPQQINLGTRAVGWLEQDIEEWISQRIALSKTLKQSQGS